MAVDQALISSDPEILSGTPVFAGTRVPARALFGYHDFPTVTREQAQAVLGLFRRTLLEQPHQSAA